MKKLFKLVVLALCCAAMFMAVGCGGSEFKRTTLTDWGALKSDGGFVAETENYVYFINGQADYTADNSFGAPVKGSLMAIKKSDLTSGELGKAEIVVPKLFAATDYNAGLKIAGDYVYYGTPSLDKDSSGKIASSVMAFSRTKLDGTGTEVLFNVNSLSAEYRIIASGDNVFVVYYDAEAKAIKSYSVKDGKATEVVKTDEKVKMTDGVAESLNAYKFVENVSGDAPVVFYTTDCYAEDYYEDAAAKDGYVRTKHNYNKVYAYTAGGEAVCVKDGKEAGLTYALTYADGDYLFYTATDVNSEETVYGVKAAEFADETKTVKINDKDALAAKTFIVDLDNVYSVDTDNGVIYKTTLTGKETEKKEIVAKTSSLGNVISVKDGYAYYYNSDNNICRIKLSAEKAEYERVSLDSAATAWFASETLTIDGKEYLFYLDNSSLGDGYVSIINLTDAEVKTDDSGSEEFKYLSGNAYLGERTTADKAKFITANIDKATAFGELEYEEVDGAPVFKKASDAIKLYKDAADDVKNAVSEEYKTKISNMEKAIELSGLYNALSEVKNYDDMTEAEKTAFKTAYDAATAKREELEKDSSVNTAVRTLTPTLYKWYYQEAAKIFD